MIDVLLTHSYFMFFDPKQEKAMMPYPPLGALYAASVLEQEGFSVRLFDTMLARHEDDIRASLEECRPSIVVFYDDDFNYLNKMCLSRMREATFTMTSIAKAYGAVVLVHSSDAADHAAEYLDHGADLIIIGEGEATLRDVCRTVLRESTGDFTVIPGVAFKKNGAVFHSPRRAVLKNLDELPFPAWHLVDVEKYKTAWKNRHGYYSINMVTTRGCPFHCNWCAKPIYGQVYNSRSPQNVVEEIKMLQQTIQPDHIWFADDIFGLKPGWIQTFADLIGKENISVRFKIQSRVDLLLESDTVHALARSGCIDVWVGAESGSQKILDAMEKGTRISQIYQARKLLQRHGIKTSFFLQFGYPGENQKDIQATIRMVKDLMPDDIGISVSYPLPGTKFFATVKNDMKEKQNWIDSDDLALMFRGTFSPAYYKQLHRYVHKVFRFHKGLLTLWNLASRKASFGWTQVRQVLLLWYYGPGILIDRCKLLYHQLS
ncbi:MAG: radical SAM protein [Ignavibacteriae bacterium]|nr:MAG: radical SAM protein [Ignavibacteriota bacterium]